MKLKKFIKKFNPKHKCTWVTYYDGDKYQVKDLKDIYANHKDLLKRQVKHMDALGSALYISIGA